MDQSIALLLVLGCYLHPILVSSIKVEKVSQAIDGLGESGVWDTNLQTELWVDIPGGAVNRLHPFLTNLTRMKAETTLSFAVPRCNGQGMVIGQHDRLDFLGYDGVQVPFLSKEKLGFEKGYGTNDGKADPLGRLWFGTLAPRDLPTDQIPSRSGLYSVTSDGVLKQHLDNLTLTNGMDWTEDGKTFLLVDSIQTVVYAFDFDMEKGEISNQRPLYTFPGGQAAGVPDGLTIDADGNVWVAIYNGAMVVKFDIKTGKELQRVDLSPVTLTTCPNFGGKNLDELYVTSGNGALTSEQSRQQPDAGAIFKVTGLGVRGRVPNLFSG